MENFVPADGKSIGFMRALQFAVPVPTVEAPAAVSNDGSGKSNKTALLWMLGIAAGIASAYFLLYLPNVKKETDAPIPPENQKGEEAR